MWFPNFILHETANLVSFYPFLFAQLIVPYPYFCKLRYFLLSFAESMSEIYKNPHISADFCLHFFSMRVGGDNSKGAWYVPVGVWPSLTIPLESLAAQGVPASMWNVI